ncbi:hypothetical protein AgCh_008657 [Apium graveolens]
MARTRRTTSTLEEGTPSGTTQVISSTVEVPPHSTYASTQGEAQTGATHPQPQGTTPPTVQGTNPQVQQIHIPVNSRPVGYEYSTIVTTNPPYGMPLHPEVGGSGYAGRSEARGRSPPYIRGLDPIPEDREFSGPYTERDSESSDDEVAPRRRRPGKEPMADGRQRPQSTPGANPQEVQEKIRAHEAEIQRLRRDLEAYQATRPHIPPRGRNPPPIIDLDGPVRRRAAVPRTDPSNLLPLGDPDDPTPPFTEEIMNAHISRKFKMPTIKAYDGTGDPANHVRTFSNALLLQPVNDAIKCRAFPQTLSGMAQRWYSRLPPNSIGSFRELSQAFIKQFISGRVHEKSSASLMSLVQGAKESLRDYLNRFTKEALKVPDLDDKVAMIALQQGTRDEFFKMSLAKRPPESMLQLQERAGKYIKVEESMRKTVVSNEPTGGKKRKTDLEYIAKDKYPRTEQNPDSTPKKGGPGQKFTEYAKLNAPRSQILMEIEKDRDIRWPKPLKADPAKLDKGKYCRFHKDVGHDTDECRQLKDEIEFLIRKGRLNKYTGDGGDRNNNGRKNFEDRRRDQDDQGRNPQPRGPVINTIYGGPRPRGPVINTIFGGPTAAGLSKNSRKAYTREVMHIVGEAPKRARTEVTLAFDDSDLEGVKFPHDDPLVITPIIGNSPVKRVLVDNGASVDILLHDTFLRMGYNDSQLTPTDMPIYGFAGVECPVEGIIKLPTTIGTEPRQATQMLDFVVVKASSTYNAIMGRTGIHAFKAVPSSYHSVMKFPTRNGIGEERGDQKMARSCYVASLRADGVGGQVLPIEDMDVRENDENRGRPAEELDSVPLDPKNPERMTFIGATLEEPLRGKLVKFLQENSDVFAWSAADMPGIDPGLITHKLNVDPSRKTVKQKKRNFAPERQEAIKQEVEKLLEAGFIEEIQFPEWLANPVMVKKANGKWRMCIDFTDLNDACPKDCFPLPRIDTLIDATAGHEMLSFMDGFSGYNQIKMHKDDIPKVSFITDFGVYCYLVMAFGLKNAGATYQRLVNKIFKDLIGKTMEVYVDDMLVKSLVKTDHITHLREAFEVLRYHKMMLNPTKCAFGVGSGKFLGLMVSKRGIEANPDKIKAILDMEPPKTVKDVQKLTGRVAALGRFISKSGDKCLSFFKSLKNIKDFVWSEENQKAFEELKKYMGQAPLLAKPVLSEVLFLYLAVSESALSAVLVKEELKVQKPVYYVSKILHGAELNYSTIEKFALALVMASRKLRPYFQAHQIEVLTNQPLRNIIHSPKASGRLIKWAIELGEFDLKYKPRIAIKAQALADFVVECTIPNQEVGGQEDTTPQDKGVDNGDKEKEYWVLYFDGASKTNSSGAGLVLQSPDGFLIEYAMKLDFPTTNNEAEYEALIAGLGLAGTLRVKNLKVRGDSKLIISQVKGEFEARDDTMAKYVRLVRAVMTQFNECHVEHIPREENVKADALSKFASSEIEESSGSVYFRVLKTRSIDVKLVAPIGLGTSWIDPIKAHIQTGWLPSDATEARKLTVRALRYSLIDGILYKRSFVVPYLRCLRPDEARLALEEVHEGICGQHLGGRALAHKITRLGFYWPEMMADAKEYVKKCDRCQKHAPVARQPPEMLTSINSPIPFAMWGMDILGPFPMATAQRKFLIVAIDYFTKWIEAKPLAKITTKQVAQFLWENIMCRYGIPRILVTDNGTQFNNEEFKKYCEENEIELRFTSVAHPQANGQAEVANRIILDGLKKRIEKSRNNWVDEILPILWAYRTTCRVTTDATPFMLAYGAEAVVPVEISHSSPRIQAFDEKENEEGQKLALDLIDEVRDKAHAKIVEYQKKASFYYNLRVKERFFKQGDLVLRKIEASGVGQKGKLAPNWEGPYRVKSVQGRGTYKLETMDGFEVPRTWHAQNLKVYYV